jgi:hypothetical protein
VIRARSACTAAGVAELGSASDCGTATGGATGTGVSVTFEARPTSPRLATSVVRRRRHQKTPATSAARLAPARIHLARPLDDGGASFAGAPLAGVAIEDGCCASGAAAGRMGAAVGAGVAVGIGAGREVGISVGVGVGREVVAGVGVGVVRGVGVLAGVGVAAGVGASWGVGVACGVGRDDGRLKLSRPGNVCEGGLAVCACTESDDTPASNKAIAPSCARRGMVM